MTTLPWFCLFALANWDGASSNVKGTQAAMDCWQSAERWFEECRGDDEEGEAHMAANEWRQVVWVLRGAIEPPHWN